MQIRQLEYFVALSENLNFTETARQFHISQGSVTFQIKSLEDEIGFRLFDCNNRHVELTPTGRTFLEDARAIIRRTDDALDRARAASAVFTGQLGIGFVKGFEKTSLSDVLSEFHIKYPNVALTLVRENVSELYDAVKNRNLDLVINLKYSMDDLEELNFNVLSYYPLLAVMPASHPLSHRTVIRREELREYPLVDIKKNDSRYGEKATIMKAFTDAGFIPTVSYVSDDIETSILAVSAGLGYALLPSYITDSFSPRDKVIAIPIEGEEKKMTVIGAWHRRNNNPALTKFLELMDSHFRSGDA